MRQEHRNHRVHPANGKLRRWAPLAVAAAAVAAQALATAPAQAATGTQVSSQGQLRVTAASGVANDVKVSLTDSTFQVSDRDEVVAGTGCTSITRNLAECVVDGPTVSINTFDGDDAVTAPVALQVLVTLGLGNDTAVTGSAADNVSGNDGADRISTGAGDDKLFGNNGDDALDGGAGRDTLTGLAGADVLVGGAGTDIVNYVGSADLGITIDDVADDGAAGEGDDVRTDVEEVQGSGGDDTIVGSNLATVTNRLLGGSGDDTLLGLGGRDLLFGQNGNDTLLGGDGLDQLDGATGADVMTGGAGDGDAVDYSTRTQTVRVDLEGDADDGETINGVPEGDKVGVDVEEIHGGSGSDVLRGNAQRNFIDGGANADTIFGGDGADVVFGGAGNDALNGEGGADRLEGNGDADTLVGGPLGDDLFGGSGVDRAIYTDKGVDEPVILTLDDLANDGTPGENDRIRSDVENLMGGNGSDTLTGDQFANNLHGGFAGADTLNGLAGDDTLDGNVGPDTLNCGAGVDVGDGGLNIDTATQCETLFNVP
jgi:Ca2+-binding RTX toxin-like protein